MTTATLPTRRERWSQATPLAQLAKLRIAMQNHMTSFAEGSITSGTLQSLMTSKFEEMEELESWVDRGSWV